MPIQPWTAPATLDSFRRPFDDRLHLPTDPKPTQAGGVGGSNLSTAEMFGPIANCDFCGRWQQLDLSDPRLESTPPQLRVAEKMRLNGWATYQGRDVCPAHGVPR
jgi:hypothetical protein